MIAPSMLPWIVIFRPLYRRVTLAPEDTPVLC